MIPSAPLILNRHMHVRGTRVFYRESVPDRVDAPVLVLLHGFPSSSQQFRQLMTVIGADYRVIAPDYPGFGYTETPEGFEYTFEQLSDVIETFIQQLNLDRFMMYLFDFGAPVGFRIAERRPEWIAGIVVQNGNAYEEGLSEAASKALWSTRDDAEAVASLQGLLTLEGTRYQYEAGVEDPQLISPDSWTMDQHFMELPGRKEAHMELFFDYHTNIQSYKRWQEWLRNYAPPTLILWGNKDPFFVTAGARASCVTSQKRSYTFLRLATLLLKLICENLCPFSRNFWTAPGPPSKLINSQGKLPAIVSSVNLGADAAFWARVGAGFAVSGPIRTTSTRLGRALAALSFLVPEAAESNSG